MTITLTPDPIEITLSIAAPFVGQVIAPDPLTITLAFPAPSVVSVITIAPSPLRIELTFPALFIGHAITPDSIVIQMAFPAPTIVGGPKTLLPLPVLMAIALRKPRIIGGTPDAQVLPRRYHRARVYIHEPWWPFRRVAEMVTAHNIDRSYERMGAGHAAFHVVRGEPQLRPGLLARGNTLVIESDDMPPWVGTILNVDGSLRDGTIEAQAQGLAAILEGRNTPQNENYTTAIGSARIIHSMLSRANARAYTGIDTPAVLGAGPAITELQVGGQSVFSALTELHNRTNWEWWLESQVDPQHIDTKLHWGSFQGQDLSDKVHLWQGRHFSEFGYKLDLSKVMQSMTTVGDFGAKLPLRQSVSRSAQLSLTADQHSARIERASVGAIQAIGQLPAGLRNEGLTYEIMTGTIAELSRRAARALERPLAATEMFNVSITRALQDWSSIRVGNYLTIHGSVEDNNDIERVVRVVGYQPDEESGEIAVVFEVPISR